MGLKSFLASLSLKVKIAVACAAVAVAGTVTAVVIANSSADNTYRVLKVFELSGSAVVSRQGAGDLNAYVGMNLESGDTLSVNSGSTLRISMDGDKYVLLDEGTVLELVAEGSPTDSRTSLNLKEGTILNELTTSLSANSSYEVSTPKATMAVRGTSFMVSVKKNEDGSYIIETDTFHGKVEAMLLGADGKPTGESAMIPAGKRVTIKTEPNPDSGKPAEVDGLSFFVYETEPGVYIIVPEGDDPVTDIVYELIPEIIKQYALNSNDSGMMVLNTEIARRLRGTNDDAVPEETKAPDTSESESAETTVPVEESETTTTTTTTAPETTTVTTVPVTEATERTVATTVPVTETTTKKTTTTTAPSTKKTTKKTTTTTAPETVTTSKTTTTTTAPTAETTTTTTTAPATEAATTTAPITDTTTTPTWTDTTPVTTEEEPPVSETYTINYVLASDTSIVVATQEEANYGDSLDASLLPIALDLGNDGTYDYYLLDKSQISGTVTGNDTISVSYELYDNVYEVKIVGGSDREQHFLEKSGATVSLPDSTASTPPDGYTFVGWGAVTSGGYATSLKEGTADDEIYDSVANDNSLYYSSSLTVYTGSVTLNPGTNNLGSSLRVRQNFKFVPVYAKIVRVTFFIGEEPHPATNAYDGDTVQQALAKTDITISAGESISLQYENGTSAELNYPVSDGDRIKVIILASPPVTG